MMLPAVAGFLMEKNWNIWAALGKSQASLRGDHGRRQDQRQDCRHRTLLQKVDAILIGGGMANTFLAAQGIDMGKSLVEAESLATAARTDGEGRRHDSSCRWICAWPLPLPPTPKTTRWWSVDDVPADWMALDIGPATIAHYANRLAGAKTVVWNGPMGVFEFPKFARAPWPLPKFWAGCAMPYDHRRR
jgi:phosphoglycerate kinase